MSSSRSVPVLTLPFPLLALQPSLVAHSSAHPELMDDFVYRIQFFRLMKRFMQACLVTDFHLDDLMAPGE